MLFTDVLRGLQVEVVVGLETDVATCIDFAAFNAEIAGFATAGRFDAGVAAGQHIAAALGDGVFFGGAAALAAAGRNADADFGVLRISGHRTGSLGTAVGCHTSGSRCQHLHAAVFGFTASVGHLINGLQGRDDRRADADRYALLFELVFGDGLADLGGRFNIDALGCDVDVALGRDDVAAGLLVGVTSCNGDVAVC